MLRVPFDMINRVTFSPAELLTMFASVPDAKPPGRRRARRRDRRTRKPIEGECPVCLEGFDVASSEESVVWCRATCGYNIHRCCMETWATAQPPGKATCPLCRSKWEEDAEKPLLLRIEVRPMGHGCVPSHAFFGVPRGLLAQAMHGAYLASALADLVCVCVCVCHAASAARRVDGGHVSGNIHHSSPAPVVLGRAATSEPRQQGSWPGGWAVWRGAGDWAR